MEAIQTPKPVATAGHEESLANPDGYLRVDGTRYCDGIHQCISTGKSIETGEDPIQGLKRVSVDIVSPAGRYCSWVEISPRVAVCARECEDGGSGL